MKALLASSVRGPGETRSVAPLELFFDLVYVFAISQLSHHLVAHFDVQTALETLVLSLAVIYAWYMTAWLSNWLSPDSHAVQALLLSIMFASLLMSSAISGAFEDRGWLFASAYLTIQIGRACFSIAVFQPGSVQRTHFVNDLLWEIVAGAVWVAGLFAHDETRLAIWTAAVAITLLGIFTAHAVPGRSSHIITPVHVHDESELVPSGVAGHHLLERLRLFFLIALGETLITTGSAFAAEEEMTAGSVVAFTNAFVTAVILWWCYFHRTEAEGLAATESAADPSGVAFLSTWKLTLMVIAILGIAVTDELAIAHPGDDPETLYLVLVFGGPALFLAAQLIFLSRLGAGGLVPRVVAIVVLGIAALAFAGTTLVAASIAATVVLLAVAVTDGRYVGGSAAHRHVGLAPEPARSARPEVPGDLEV